MTRMEITIDFDRCQSNGLCMAAAPAIFEVRDDGYLYILVEHPGAEHRSSVEEAARLCPTQAIAVAGLD
jgi:ferredoxin